MTSTIARRVNSFVATSILNGVSEEGRADKAAVEDIVANGASELRRALRDGKKAAKPNEDVLEEAEAMYENLLENLDVVEQYIPEFTAINDLIESLSITSTPDFAKVSLIEGFCAKIRSADRLMSMNKFGRQTMGGLKGQGDEQLAAIAARIGITGELHQRAFAWAYEGATLSDADFVKKQIARRVKVIGDSLLAVDLTTRNAVIRYCNTVFLSRLKEDSQLAASVKKRKAMNPGKRSTTVVGGAAADLEAAIERAMAKGMEKGSEAMLAALVKKLPELAKAMEANARAEAFTVVNDG